VIALILMLGAVVGGGLWFTAVSLRMPRPGLANTVATLKHGTRVSGANPGQGTAPAARRASEARSTGWAARYGERLAPLLVAAGLPGSRTRADLIAVGVSVERHLAEKAVTAVLGLLVPWPLLLLATAVGVDTGWIAPTAMALMLAGTGFFVPDLTLRSRAAAWRLEVRFALSTLLNVTAICLSGGGGVEQSLRDAAAEGQGEAFAAFRRALREAELTRTPPWDRLRILGERLGVEELDELAASIALAGGEGARVRASLTAKATSVRAHLLADSEAAASSATEKMSVPIALMLTGFLVTLGYPALAHALQSL
jgi:tight adherence protein C